MGTPEVQVLETWFFPCSTALPSTTIRTPRDPVVVVPVWQIGRVDTNDGSSGSTEDAGVAGGSGLLLPAASIPMDLPKNGSNASPGGGEAVQVIPKNGVIEMKLERGGARAVAGGGGAEPPETFGRGGLMVVDQEHEPHLSGAAVEVGAPPGNDLVTLEDSSKSAVVVEPHTGSATEVGTSARLTELNVGGVGARAFAGVGVASFEDTKSAEFFQNHVPPRAGKRKEGLNWGGKLGDKIGECKSKYILIACPN